MSSATSVGGKNFSVSVTVKDNSEAVLRLVEQNVSSALNAMATATVQRAKMLAPMSNKETSGNLRDSGRVESEGTLDKAAVFGNSVVPYARYQEFGGDGRRVVRNYTTPGTQAHYLQDAGESVAKEGLKKYL